MRFQESPERIIPHDYEIFIGLDVDKSSISVTALDFAGGKKQVHMPYSAQRLVRFINKHYREQKVVLVYEAGPTGYGLYDALREAGHMCLVTAPAMVPRERGRRVKTNRVDSEQLAYRLRGGDLRGIRVPSPVYRKLRYLTHQWNQLSRRTRAVMCQIKALLLMEELVFPGDKWNKMALEQLREMECAPSVQFILRQQVSLLITLQKAQRQLLREIRAYCRSDEQLRKDLGYVISIPGIGMVIGMQLLARIGDWRRMKRGRELAALLGLAPWEHSTGTRVVRGGISRTGDRHLRCLLIEAAWTARKREPELGAFYTRLASRNPQGKGSRKAVVAVARKMTQRVYRVLKDQRNYEIRPPAQVMASEKI